MDTHIKRLKGKAETVFRYLRRTGIMLLLPWVALAQNSGNGDYPASIDTLGDVIALIDAIVSDLIPIAASLALLAFFWGLAKYIFKAGDQDAVDDAKEKMIVGVVALFLIAAVGGIVELLAATLGIEDPGSSSIPVPSVGPGEGGG